MDHETEVAAALGVMNDPDELPEYLTPRRKRAAAVLASLGGELEHRKLKVTVTKDAADLEVLDKALRALADMAPVFDTV